MLELVVDCSAIPVVCTVDDSGEEDSSLREGYDSLILHCVVGDVVLSVQEKEVVLSCRCECP